MRDWEKFFYCIPAERRRWSRELFPLFCPLKTTDFLFLSRQVPVISRLLLIIFDFLSGKGYWFDFDVPFQYTHCLLEWQCITEGSVDCLLTKQKKLWAILMSTITILYNFVFCFLSFIYIWIEYKKRTMTNKNHLFVSQFSIGALYLIPLVLTVNRHITYSRPCYSHRRWIVFVL